MNVVGKLEPTKVEFRWKIENFSEMISLSVGTVVYSPHFVTSYSDDASAEWGLKMYPAGKSEERKDFIGLFIVYFGQTETKATCLFSVLNESSNTIYASRCIEEHLYENGMSGGYNAFLKKDSIINEDRNTLVDDVLTISCVVSVSNCCENSDDDKVSAFNYFGELLENGKFTDVTLVLGRKRILLHKAILTSISPVFQAMFEHEMKEKKENVVKITDMKYNVALEMFRYVYSRKVKNIDEIAGDLLVAADKYAITGLKSLCESSLLCGLSVDNAFKRLQFVTTYETTFLKAKVIEFILSHLKELIDTPEYKQLNVECKDEIIKALANKTNQ